MATTDDVTAERIDSLNTKLSRAHRRRAEIDGEIEHLNFEITTLEAGADLPKEPGWYLTADDTPARLDEDGNWDDGWGNSGPDYGPAWWPLPLRRMHVTEEQG